MVESEAHELSEDDMLGAVMFGHRGFQPVIEGIIKLAEKAAREPRELVIADNSELYGKVKDIAGEALGAAYSIAEKTARQDAVAAAKAKVVETLIPEGAEDAPTVMLKSSWARCNATAASAVAQERSVGFLE